MTAIGVYPKTTGDIFYSEDHNVLKQSLYDVYPNISIGSLTASSGVGTTVTITQASHFTIYNEGVVNAYLVIGSPASVSSGLIIYPSETIQLNGYATQLSANTLSGTATLKFITQ